MELARKQREVVVELTEQKILRAAYSERQLEEVMVDFWFNHFNVFAGKGADAQLPDRVRARRHPAARARQVPRPARRHREEPGDALLSRQLAERAIPRRRRDAAAADGGDAARSADAARRPRLGARLPMPAPPAARGAESQRAEPAARGLNENYARELMELHTLGVDGGYTQQDVHQRRARLHRLDDRRPAPGRRLPLRAAHARRRREDGARPHDQGRRRSVATASRCSTSWRGIPSTAQFISTKLARRFVSDTPPPALVDRAAKRLPRDRRRHPRGRADDPHLAGVLLGRRPTARRSRRRSSSWSARCARPAPTCRRGCRSSQAVRAARHAALHVPAADRLRRHAPTRGSTPARCSNRMNFARAAASPRRGCAAVQPAPPIRIGARHAGQGRPRRRSLRATPSTIAQGAADPQQVAALVARLARNSRR